MTKAAPPVSELGLNPVFQLGLAFSKQLCRNPWGVSDETKATLRAQVHRSMQFAYDLGYDDGKRDASKRRRKRTRAARRKPHGHLHHCLPVQPAP